MNVSLHRFASVLAILTLFVSTTLVGPVSVTYAQIAAPIHKNLIQRHPT